MKKILLWDPRFPDRAPTRLTLVDAVASACVRAGVAAAADPTEQGSLVAGGVLSGATPVEVALQHGATNLNVRRVFVPLSVAQLAIAAGVAAPVGIVGLDIPIAIPPVGKLQFNDPANSIFATM